jgi:hypothetical protein
MILGQAKLSTENESVELNDQDAEELATALDFM